MVCVRVGRVAAAVALVDGVGGARPHVEHDDEDEHHDAEGSHDDADHLSTASMDNAVRFFIQYNLPIPSCCEGASKYDVHIRRTGDVGKRS